MMSGYCSLNKKRFSSRRKVDSELAATTSVGSVFQMCGAATAKARLPTVDSLTGGTTRRLALAERSVLMHGHSFQWMQTKFVSAGETVLQTAMQYAVNLPPISGRQYDTRPIARLQQNLTTTVFVFSFCNASIDTNLKQDIAPRAARRYNPRR